MPESRLPNPTPIEHPDGTLTPLKVSADIISDAYAKSLVLDNFIQWETWRSLNHDTRWKMHDQLYFGAMPQKFWPGTSVQRSNFSVPIIFEQIETAVPMLLQAIFYDRNWFGIEAEEDSDPKQARNIQAHLSYICTYSRDNLGRGFETEAEHFLRSLTKYGNGVFMLEWDHDRKQVAIEWRDLRDIYIDPGTPTPFIDDSRGVIVRNLMTVDSLDSMRDQEGLSIPPRAALIAYSRSIAGALADDTKRSAEAARGVNFVPTADNWIPAPADNMVEVLVYYSKTRIIWLIGRDWVAMNAENPYGFVPLVSAPCYPVLSRFYGQSVADILQDNQQYSASIYNAHLDEMNLRLLPPRSAPAGTVRTPSSLRWYPGAVQQVDKPEDLVVHTPEGNMVPVENELAFMDQSAQRHTGINAGAMAGTPTPSNANRTAGGVNAQAQAVSTRLNLLVKHFEQYAMIPMFHKILKMTQVEAEPGTMLPGVDEQGKQVQVPAEDLSAQVRFRIYGSSKMVSRAQLQQVFQTASQFLLGGPFIQGINQTGKTVDFDEFLALMQDATGASRIYNLVRPMTPQEQQALSQPNPQVVAQQQMHDKEQQTRLQMGQMKVQGDVQVAQIKAETDTHKTTEESARHIMEMLQNDPELQMQFEQQQAELEAQMEQAKNQQQLQFTAQAHQQKLAHNAQLHSQKLTQGLHQTAIDAFRGHATHQADAQRDQASHALEAFGALHGITQKAAESRAGIERADTESAAKLDRGKAESEAKIAAMKKQAAVLSKARPKPSAKKS